MALGLWVLAALGVAGPITAAVGIGLAMTADAPVADAIPIESVRQSQTRPASLPQFAALRSQARVFQQPAR